MKIRKKGETLVEETDEKKGETLVEETDEKKGETLVEETDEEKKEREEGDEKIEEEKFLKLINPKINELVKALRETPQRKVIDSKEMNLEKSIMETDPYLRKKKPFVQLSKKMDDFVKDAICLARGGITQVQKALSEGDDTAGGFTVPEEFDTEVIRYASEEAIVRPRARVFNMTRDKYSVTKLDQSADQFAGVELYYVEEGEEKKASQPKFGRITLSVKKLIGLSVVTDELLEDSAVNIANYLITLFGEALAYKEDKMFLTGTGMTQPLGIIAGAGLTETRATASRIKIVDVIKMFEKLPAWATPGAVWITTKKGWGQFMRMRADAVTAGDEAGAMLFLPSMISAIPSTLCGLDILMTDKLPDVGTKGDLILANLSWYYIGDRGAIQITSSIHDRFRYDETTFRFVKRHDGQPGISKAFVVLV